MSALTFIHALDHAKHSKATKTIGKRMRRRGTYCTTKSLPRGGASGCRWGNTRPRQARYASASICWRGADSLSCFGIGTVVASLWPGVAQERNLPGGPLPHGLPFGVPAHLLAVQDIRPRHPCGPDSEPTTQDFVSFARLLACHTLTAPRISSSSRPMSPSHPSDQAGTRH